MSPSALVSMSPPRPRLHCCISSQSSVVSSETSRHTQAYQSPVLSPVWHEALGDIGLDLCKGLGVTDPPSPRSVSRALHGPVSSVLGL